MCDKDGTLHWTTYSIFIVYCFSAHRLHCLRQNNWHAHYLNKTTYAFGGSLEWDRVSIFTSDNMFRTTVGHRNQEYILDLHGSMSMSSDTLYSNCPFIRSSMEYFPYRPLVCWGPINSDPFTLYAVVVGNADCIKYNAIEITNTERNTGRCERILSIVIRFLSGCCVQMEMASITEHRSNTLIPQWRT